MEKYIVYLINEDESKSPVFECETLELANAFMKNKSEVFSLELQSDIGSLIIF